MVVLVVVVVLKAKQLQTRREGRVMIVHVVASMIKPRGERPSFGGEDRPRRGLTLIVHAVKVV